MRIKDDVFGVNIIDEYAFDINCTLSGEDKVNLVKAQKMFGENLTLKKVY